MRDFPKPSPHCHTNITVFLTPVVCCRKLNNKRDCDAHLFGQVSTCTGRYQLHCRYFAAQMCTEDTLAHNLDVMSYNSLTTQLYTK